MLKSVFLDGYSKFQHQCFFSPNLRALSPLSLNLNVPPTSFSFSFACSFFPMIDEILSLCLLQSPNLGALDCSQNLARKDVHPKSRRPARHFHDVSAVVWDLNTAAPSPGALSERWTALDGQMCPCSRLNKIVGGASSGQSPLTSRWRRG